MTSRALYLVTATLIGCGSGGGFPDAPEIDSPPPLGTFSLAWSLTDTNNQPITCDQIGAQSVTALVRNRAVQGGSTQVFACSTMMGTSEALVPGTYDIDFELVGVGGAPMTGLIATSPVQLAVVIPSGGSVALTPLAFAVNATGGMKLHLSTAATMNCTPTAAGGSGITTHTITLNKASDSTCAPITFAIAANGTQPARTYTVDCATPAVVPCIERDQEISVTGIAAGGYIIHIRGSAPTECFSNNDSLSVPPLGRDLVRTLNLGLELSTAACQ